MLRNNIQKVIKKTAILFIVIVVFFVAKKVFAQADLGINSLAEGGVELGQTDIRIIVARIIQAFLGLLGTVAVVLIIYGGWLYMTAAGNPEQIARAKKLLINAIIGLAIILSSLAISQFIVNALNRAIYGGPGGASGPNNYSQPLSGSLGAGIISHHIPERGASAPRNTKIAITFKEAIDQTSIILDSDGSGTFGDNGDQINKEVFKMVDTTLLKQNNNNFNNINDGDLVDLTAKFTPDKKNFVFAPTELLGNPTEAASYTILISSELKKEDGTDAFSAVFSGGYQWEFQIDPVIDTTPPVLQSLIPQSGLHPRNTIVQMNFSESIDPTSATGDFFAGSGFQNITLSSEGAIISGKYKIANGYKTVEFITDNLCGTNSCGGDVFCLPGSSLITGLIKAATVADAPQAAGFPYDGVVDMAGNSFDGNSDGIAQGPSSQSGNDPYMWPGGSGGDDLSWSFNTSDQIDLVPPKIISILPEFSAQNVGVNDPVEATFDKVMSAFSLNNNNLAITHDVPPPYEFWYSINAVPLDSNSNPVPAGNTPQRTKAVIKHGSFAPSELPPAPQYNYYPIVSSRVQDLRQNCYNPSEGPNCIPTPSLPYCCNGTPSASKCNYIP